MHGEQFFLNYYFSPHSALKQVATCHSYIVVAQLLCWLELSINSVKTFLDITQYRRAKLKELLLQICLQHHGQQHGFIDIQHSSATDGSETWLRSEILTCTNLGRSAVHRILI